ncbi:MAG: VWA domain-containing protein [Acidobacteriota bacterium]
MKKTCILAMLLSVVLVAQQELPIRVDVPVVFLPVTVTDADGKYIDGLEASEFEITDNGKPVAFEMTTSDSVTAPLALVVAVQTNEGAMTALQKIQKTGNVVPTLISGARGSVMLLAFGDEVKTIQGWTRDANDISRAFRALRPQWTAKARMLDAISEGIAQLSQRAPEERRVLIVISESKDRGSKAELQHVAEAAQRAGVTIDAVSYSAYATAFTKKGAQQPAGNGGFNILGIFSEIGRLGKENTLEALTLASGGRSRGFTTQKGLEEELGNTGEEIHSQYLLSFTPASPKQGYHQLFVRVKSRADASVRTRPGYWAGEPKAE